MVVVINLAGPFHSVFTVTGTFIAPVLLLRAIVQVRLTLDPTGRTGVFGIPSTIKEFGTGTVL